MKITAIVLVAFGTLVRAQHSLTDVAAGGRPGWDRVRDSLEIRRLELEVQRADLAVSNTDFWHRLIPSMSVGASFAVRGVTFVEATEPNPFVIPSDLYRLTVSLSISDLINSYDHERARLVKEQAHLELSLAQTQQIIDRQVALERARRIRSELSLMEEVLRLSERLLRFYALLFDQGKTSFDVYLRCELQTIEARQNVLRLRSELGEGSIN